MSSAIIVTLIIAGIGIMVLAAFIAQSVENARKERQRKIGIINERIRNLTGMISDIPPSYLSPELRQFMVLLLKQNYHAILALDPKQASATSKVKQLDELLKQPIQSQLDTLQPPFNDVITGQGIRSRIKDLVNTMVGMHKDGSLDKDVALKHINLGKTMFELVSVDLTLLNARNAESSKNIKSAAVHYGNALRGLSKINGKKLTPKRYNFASNKAKELKQQLLKLQQEMVESSRPEDADDEWSKFKSKHDASRIKQEYE